MRLGENRQLDCLVLKRIPLMSYLKLHVIKRANRNPNKPKLNKKSPFFLIHQ